MKTLGQWLAILLLTCWSCGEAMASWNWDWNTNPPRTSSVPDYGLLTLAPANGLGMPPTWGCYPASAIHMVTSDGDAGVAISFARASVRTCISPDGQSSIQCAADQICVTTGSPLSTVLGVSIDQLLSNWLLNSEDMSAAGWDAGGVTCAKSAIGMSDAGGSLCTAQSSNGIITQQVLPGSVFNAAVGSYYKANVLTGSAWALAPDCTTWVDITTQLSTAKWKRTTPYEGTAGCAYDSCIPDSRFQTEASSNPCIGLKLQNPGDSVYVALNDMEISGLKVRNVTSPTRTGAALVTRQGDVLSFISPFSFRTDDVSVSAAVVGGNTNLNGTILFMGSISTVSSATTDSIQLWSGPFTPTGLFGCSQGDHVGGNNNSAVTGTEGIATIACRFNDAGVEGQVAGTVLKFGGPGGTFNTDGGMVFGQLNLPGANRQTNGVISQLRIARYNDYIAPTVQTAPDDVCIIGDSLIEGQSDQSPQNACGTLETLLTTRDGRARRCWNGGVGSATTTVITGIPNCVETYNKYASSACRTLIWECGTNDLASSVSAATLWAATLPSLNDALARGKRVMIPGILCRGGNVGWTAAMETQRTTYNTTLSTTGVDAGFIYVDTSQMCDNSATPAIITGDKAADSLHLTYTGGKHLGHVYFDGGIP